MFTISSLLQNKAILESKEINTVKGYNLANFNNLYLA